MDTKQKFAVIDSTNHLIKCFDSYQAADAFKSMNNRFDWLIVLSTNNRSTISCGSFL